MTAQKPWRGTQAEARQRYLAKYDDQEALRFEGWMRAATEQDQQACLQDLSNVVSLKSDLRVLDVGAGTGTLCRTFCRIPGLRLTALEPSPAMIASLRKQPELQQVAIVEGFTDAASDTSLFAAESFDLIASRQLVNNLFDPLAAFRNWKHWLAPAGRVLVMDGLFDRDSWTDQWNDELDRLPLSACRTMATVPYLLELAGFRIDAVAWMTASNALPTARTPRYVVCASHGADDDRGVRAP